MPLVFQWPSESVAQYRPSTENLPHRPFATVTHCQRGRKMAAKKATSQPFAIPFTHAIKNDSIGRDKGYSLIRGGEWESYMDGGIRMVTIASINTRRERLLAESRGTFTPAQLRGQAPTILQPAE